MSESGGSGKPGDRKGRILLLPEVAEELFYELEDRQETIFQGIEWAVGGGSVLTARWNHRESRDLDVFINETLWHEWKALGGEQKTRRTFAEQATRVRPSGDRAVKIGPIETDEGTGSIDIIALPARCGMPGEGRDQVEGRSTRNALDTWSILAAKLMGRGHEARNRDVYDMAVALDREPKEASAAIAGLTAEELGGTLHAVQAMEWTPEAGAHRVRGARDAEALENAPRKLVEALRESAKTRSKTVKKEGKER